MSLNLVDVLRECRDGTLSSVASQALAFIEHAKNRQFTQWSAIGRSAAIARTWEIRKSLPKFKRAAFVGLDESIEALLANDIPVKGSLVETESGAVVVWIDETSGSPVGIIVLMYEDDAMQSQ